MALMFMEGFDHYTHLDQEANKWVAYASNYVDISSTYSRWSGGQGLRVEANSPSYNPYLTFDNKATLVVGFAFKQSDVGTPGLDTSYPFLRLMDAATTQLIFCLDADWTIKVYRYVGGGAVLLGTTSSAFLTSPGQWKYFETKVTIDNTAGAVEIRRDGVSILNLTGQDTQYSANAYVNGLYLANIYNNKDACYDDMYLDDANYHGEVRVHTFYPDSDGTHTDFTPSTGSNYQCVDEQGTINEDTDYVSSATVGHKDTYGITTGTLDTVHGIQVTNCVKKTDAGTRKIKPLCRSNSTDYQGTERDLETDYKLESQVWENDPDDSNAWTQTKLEAAEYGLEVTA